MSERPLEGKVALVTGAGSTIGLGRAMTLALVRAGARVAMMDLDAASLEQSAADARQVGGQGCRSQNRTGRLDSCAHARQPSPIQACDQAGSGHRTG